nr:uncharacterized protein LOC109155623 isoform X3 [Ipomoea trifida]
MLMHHPTKCTALASIHVGPTTQRPVIISDEDRDSDDEFHTAPRDPVVQDRQRPPRARRMPRDGLLPKINTRGVPRELVNVVTGLNQCQRQHVCDTGMGGLLGFQVNEISLSLGYWLVSNFDPSQMRLKLANGSFISVTKEDVATVLGLPNGFVPIIERDSPASSQQTCRGSGTTRKRGSSRGLRRRPAGEGRTANCRGGQRAKGGANAIADWTVVSYVATERQRPEARAAEMRSVSNGYVNQQIVHMFGDVNKIKDLDWCGYLLHSLVAACEFWVEDKSRKFTGPLMFLTLLYVDRLVVGARDIPRSIPVLDGWTTELLKTREAREVVAQGFGHGMVDAPPQETNMLPRFVTALGGAPHPQHVPGPSTGHPMHGRTTELLKTREAREVAAHGFGHGMVDAPPQETNTPARGLRRNSIAQPHSYFSTVTRVVDMVNHHRELAHQDPNYTRLVEAATLINKVTHTGIDDTLCNTAVEPQLAIPSSSQQDDAFWLDPTNIEALERLEKAAVQATTVSDMPSFSLGLTQDFAPTADAGGTTNARDVNTPSTQQTRAIQQPWSQCLAPQRNDHQDPKGKRPLMQDPRHFCINEVLFNHKSRTAKWVDFLTLREGSSVEPLVVNTWSCVLNHREKSEEGECRHACLPQQLLRYVGTIVDIIADQNDRVKWFEKRLDMDLQTTNHVRTATLDMYLFPVIQQGRYYVISVNFRQQRLDILDNSSKRRSNGDKYLDAPMELIHMLSAYLVSKQQGVRARQLRNMRLIRMQMPCGDTICNADSGVFAMRHIESFTGQDHSNWQCGLQTGNAHQIINLRKRIMHNILLAEINLHTQPVTNRVAQYDSDRFSLPST